MRITSTDIWSVVVPTIPGRVHSPECVAETEWDRAPKQILRLNTDTEHFGIGETERAIPVDDVQRGARLLLGREPESMSFHNIYWNGGGGDAGIDPEGSDPRGSVYAALEMAALDVVGKARRLPLHAMLGGAVQKKVKADYWIGHQTPEDGARSVERALVHGFKGVKIKCRIEEPIVERLQAMLDVAGPEFKVTVDPNQRFHTAGQTIELALRLEPLGNVEVFEDPIPKTDTEGYLQIREAIEQPVAMHLGDASKALEAIVAGTADCFNFGGSIGEFTRSAGVAAAAHMQCWHGSGNDLGILDTAAVHASALNANCTMASDFVGSWTREDDLIVEPIPFEDGYVPTPTRPGLGCELDMGALERYSIDHVEVT